MHVRVHVFVVQVVRAAVEVTRPMARSITISKFTHISGQS